MHAAPVKQPRFHVLPTTPLGKRALMLFGISLLAWVLTPLAAVPYLGWVVWAFGVAGTIALVGSGVYAVRAIAKDKDRALTNIAIVVAVLWFLISVVIILASGGD